VELLGSIDGVILVRPFDPWQAIRVEEKPEVRKAGGVYYSPQYVVDYIVKNTVGKLIEGKTPKQIENYDSRSGVRFGIVPDWRVSCLIDYHNPLSRRPSQEAEVHPLFSRLSEG